MPFGPYKDFADCVAQNQGMENPEGYCAWLEDRIKDGKNSLLDSHHMRLAIMDVDALPLAIEPAEETPTPDLQTREDFHSLLVVEGVWTGDGRYIDDEALSWRDLPLPMMGLDKTTDAHLEARLIGNLTRIEREGREIHGYGTFVNTDDPEVLRLQQLIKDGSLRGVSVDLDAMEYEVIVPNTQSKIEIKVEDEEEDLPDEEEDDEIIMPVEEVKMRVTSARIMGATVVPFPAFQEAYIESMASLTAAISTEEKISGFIDSFAKYDGIDFTPPDGARSEAQKGLDWRDEFGRGGTEVGIARARDISNGKSLSPDTINRMVSFFARHEVDKQGEGWSPDEDGFPSNGRIAWALWGGDPGRSWAEKVQRQMKREDEMAIVAAGHPIEAPICPPSSWFSNPSLDGPTPMTLTDEGRIFGHVATWATCHIGFTDQCVTPPRSAANYSHYLTGEILCDDGIRIPVGQITMDTGHAPLSANGAKALAHYDHTGTAVADVIVGEDDYGIWMAGALRPDVDATKIRGLMASDVSGDWRRIGGNLELVGVLAVNVPGFPKARIQVGEYQGLVASLVASMPVNEGSVSKPDLSQVVNRIAASIGRTKEDRKREVRSRVHKED